MDLHAVRKINSLGQITIPSSLLDILDIRVNDTCIIYTNVALQVIYLEKLVYACPICGEKDDLTSFLNLPVCHNCISHMKSRALLLNKRFKLFNFPLTHRIVIPAKIREARNIQSQDTLMIHIKKEGLPGLIIEKCKQKSLIIN